MVILSRKMINPLTVGRLIIYRRILEQLANEGTEHIFSRDIAVLAGASASLVRQDLMKVSSNGTPQNGYSVLELSHAVTKCLGTTKKLPAVLLGAGHIGQAILHYLKSTQPHLEMKAVFEINPSLVGTNLCNVTICDVSTLEEHLRSNPAQVAILALPAAEAQEAADRLVAADVCSILNFTSVRLQVPERVFVENNDIQMSLERGAFYGDEGLI
jgi:redox-sensing transcriptional repressor